MINLRNNQQGFTLIELLITVAIFTIVVTAIYSTFITGLTAKKRGENIVSTYQEARIIFDKLASDLRNVVNYSGYKFIGKSDQLTFPALLNISDSVKVNRAEIFRINYSLQGSQNDTSIVLKRTVARPGKDTIEEDLVITYFDQLNLEYCYLDKEKKYRWEKNWGKNNSFPLAIKIGLFLKGDSNSGAHTIFKRTVPISVCSWTEGGEE